MKKCRVLLWALLPALLLSLSGCQGLSDWLLDPDVAPPVASPTPLRPLQPPSGPPRNDLFGIPWLPSDTVRPLTDRSRFNAQWHRLVYEGLFALDAAFEPTPALCASYTTQDNLVYLFRLRDDVRFHDGAALTAADAAASLTAACGRDSVYAAALSEVVSVRAADPMTVEVTLAAPNPRLPALLTAPILPQNAEALVVPPGTGPYVPQIDDDHPHLLASADWWRREPRSVSRIELIPIETSDRLIYAFETRAISLVEQNPTDTTAIHYGGDYETWEYDTPILQYVGFNTKHPLLQDPALRRALALAVDRETICRELYGGRWAVPAVLPLPPASPLYNKTLAGQNGYDLARLSALFTDLSLEDRDEDGILEYPISRHRRQALSFTLIVGAENAERVAAARRVAQTLGDMGVAVEVSALPFNTFLTAIKEGAFDLYYAEATLTPDFNPLVFDADGALGYGFYHDAETAALWEAVCTAAPGETAGARDAFWRRWLEESPIVPVLFKRQALLTQRGLATNPAPLFDNLFANLPAWR
ncbi:MAG: ABC transporter substrate-binding protein [Oscillospiraceae bacterium]|jgi:peptide/nickel transport system substrate-binding protein|nr:ABC transporter substrate-binding protein [Oscillospiraceae bacterium]